MLQTPPSKEELGYADSVYTDELGDTAVVVFKMEGKDSRISTIVIRGATENYMDDIERAVDDGVNTFKGLSRVRGVIICCPKADLRRLKIQIFL